MPVGYHMDTAMVPASTMKVVTTATALEKLGADFRFETNLQITGPVAADGTLEGNLVVKGGGDPTLGESQIAKTILIEGNSALSDHTRRVLPVERRHKSLTGES